MLNRLLLAAIAVGFVLTFSLQTGPAQAANQMMNGMTCKDAAKKHFPNDRKLRREWEKACKKIWKAHQGK
jgi:hypothetical protein